MARVDYKALGMDAKLERKYKTCAKCNNEAAVTVRCPVRERQKDCRNPYVCVYCCWHCGYSKQTPLGRVCSLKVNQKKREQRLQKTLKRKKKQSDYDADYSFFDISE